MAVYAATPPEVSHCLLGLEVASPAQTPRGPAGTWLSRSAPCMQNSGASVGLFLPDTHTVFLQRQNLVPAVQGTTLKPPLLLHFHLCVEDFAAPCSPSTLAGTFSVETPALVCPGILASQLCWAPQGTTLVRFFEQCGWWCSGIRQTASKIS